MEYIVSTEEMYRFDNYTSKNLHIPEAVLMERAALCVYEGIHSYISEKTKCEKPILVLCGVGNNGGDGLAIGRLLYLKGYDVRIMLIGNLEKASESNKLQLDILRAYEEKNGVSIVKRIAVTEWLEYACALDKDRFSVVVDALFGVGLTRTLSDAYERILEDINKLSALKVAVDIPTGINADGQILTKEPFRADLTYTFGFKKIGHMVHPSREYCGEIIVSEMGIDDNSLCGDGPKYRHITKMADVNWPRRITGANKATYGKLLVIAGNEDIFGALLLCVGAALASGVGMIAVITHENNRQILADKFPEVMLRTISSSTKENEIEEIFCDLEKWCTGILIGPGIGTGDVSTILVRDAINKSTKPILVDADAINVLSKNKDLVQNLSKQSERKVILTPHMMEFSRLSGLPISELKKSYLTETKLLSDNIHSNIICKDAVSVISGYGKEYSFLNDSGNDGMASAGSGDVLSGIGAVLMLQMEDTFMAAVAASYIHGVAGTKAAQKWGVRGMKATDITNELKGLWID